jgi:hypothetical protein
VIPSSQLTHCCTYHWLNLPPYIILIYTNDALASHNNQEVASYLSIYREEVCKMINLETINFLSMDNSITDASPDFFCAVVFLLVRCCLCPLIGPLHHLLMSRVPKTKQFTPRKLKGAK